MNLKLFVGEKVIASLPVDPSFATTEYHLKAFRRLLVMRHYKNLVALKKEPLFLLESSGQKK